TRGALRGQRALRRGRGSALGAAGRADRRGGTRAQRARAYLHGSHARRAAMSIQLGTAPLPPASGSSPWSRLTRAFRQLANDPNPILLRELRQAARLTRTPVILAVVTSMMTLLIASIGGVLSVGTEPAQVGIGIFHTFFSLAFAVV